MGIMLVEKIIGVRVMNWKKIWSDPVWSKVIATGICVVLGYVLLRLGGWETILWNAVTAAWAYSTASMTVPRWVVVIVGGWSLLTLGLAVAARLRPAPTENWLSYQEDELFGLVWRWKLTDSGRPYRLCVFCPACDLQLDPVCDDFAYDPVTSFRCKCGQAGPWQFRESWDSFENHIEKTIQQKLRNGTWKLAAKR
jgi:hypothetical protein